MPGATITDPLSALRGPVADHTSYKDAAGNQLEYMKEVDEFRANETIELFDWVSFVAATTTVPLSVEVMDVSDATAETLCIGVALEPAVAGQTVRVCTRGITLCNIGDTGTIVAGDLAVHHATDDGAAAVVAIAALAATTVVTTILGTFLGPEVGTTGQAPVFVHKM